MEKPFDHIKSLLETTKPECESVLIHPSSNGFYELDKKEFEEMIVELEIKLLLQVPLSKMERLFIYMLCNSY